MNTIGIGKLYIRIQKLKCQEKNNCAYDTSKIKVSGTL